MLYGTVSTKMTVGKNKEDIARFYKQLKQRGRPHQAVKLKSSLSESEIAHFAVNRHQFPGVKIF